MNPQTFSSSNQEKLFDKSTATTVKVEKRSPMSNYQRKAMNEAETPISKSLMEARNRKKAQMEGPNGSGLKSVFATLNSYDQQVTERLLQEKAIVFCDFAKEVRINRARLIDWFFEICLSFRLGWAVLWKGVQLLDLMIKDGLITINNIHICGVCSLWMAAKYTLSQPGNFSLEAILSSVVHRKFSKEEMLTCEARILKWLTGKGLGMAVYSTYDKVCFLCKNQALSQGEVKSLLIELTLIFSDPTIGINQGFSGKVSEIEVIQEVYRILIDRKERVVEARIVEEYYEKQYDCVNITKKGMLLDL